MKTLTLFSLMLLVCACANAAGFPIRQSAKELGLKYELTAEADDKGVVIVSLKILDPGKLKTLNAVTLEIPEYGVDGKATSYPNIFPLAVKDVDGKLTTWAQLNRKYAERASIHLVPKEPVEGPVFGWEFFVISLADQIRERPAAPDNK